MEQTTEQTTQPTMRILKAGTCNSLSGRSVLTYQVGCLPTDGDVAAMSTVHIRIQSNSGKGYYSKEWVSLQAVQELFDKSAVENSASSACLNALFAGRSVNTAGFLLAVLKQEGLVANRGDKPRYYERLDAKGFYAELSKLADTNLEQSPSEVPAKAASNKSRKATNTA